MKFSDLPQEKADALTGLLAVMLPLQDQIRSLQAALASAVATWRAAGGVSETLSLLDDGEQIPDGADGTPKEHVRIAPFEVILVGPRE